MALIIISPRSIVHPSVDVLILKLMTIIQWSNDIRCSHILCYSTCAYTHTLFTGFDNEISFPDAFTVVLRVGTVEKQLLFTQFLFSIVLIISSFSSIGSFSDEISVLFNGWLLFRLYWFKILAKLQEWWFRKIKYD